MKIQELWEKVIKGDYIAINSQECSITGEEARQYSPYGFTLAPVGTGAKYHITSNGRVQEYDDITGEWLYLKQEEM